MEATEDVLHSVDTQKEPNISADTPTSNNKCGDTVFDNTSIITQTKQHDILAECLSSNSIEIQINEKSSDVSEREYSSDLVYVEDLEVTNGNETLNVSPEKPEATCDMAANLKDKTDDSSYTIVINDEKSVDDDENSSNTPQANITTCNDLESNVVEVFDKEGASYIDNGNIKKTEDSVKLLDESLEEVQDSMAQSCAATFPINEGNTANIECVTLDSDTEKDESNSNKSIVNISQTNDQTMAGAINPEIMLEGVEILHDNDENSQSQINQVEEIRPVNSEKENGDLVVSQLLSGSQMEETDSTDVILCSTENDCIEKINDENMLVDEHANLSAEELNKNTTPHDVPSDNIEEQVSNIVQMDESQLHPKPVESISIAEAISRDFDETDTEDADVRQENTEQLKTSQVLHDSTTVDNVNDQLQHQTVTVTDNSGQIYYVQSVQDLIVVENDMPSNLDEPETIEVTVLSEMEESSQDGYRSGKAKERPPIPSHILGRNIDNPAVDTFRNGKVPPKPRLGVKIPYKNLTSQIVSKDEIAKEILERQKQKYKQSGQSTRETLFAKKITQRLAKRIAPPCSESPQPIVVERSKDEEAINNSDLLAILEGDEGDSEPREVSDTKVASTSKVVDNINESGTSMNSKQNQLAKTNSSKSISKLIEREIALKQLKELPLAPRRRRNFSPSASSKKNADVSVIVDNELALENDVPALVEVVDKPVMNSSGGHKTLIENSKPGDSNTNIEQKKVSTKVNSSVTKNSEDDASDTIVVSKGILHHSTGTESKNTSNKELPTTPTKSDVTKVKSAEVKHVATKEITKIPVTETAKAKPNDIQHSLVETTSKIKTDDANHTDGIKENDKSKVDVSTNSVSGKVTERSKVISKFPAEAKPEIVGRKHIGNPPIKTYTRKRKSTEEISVISNVLEKKSTVHKDVNIPPNTYITKSSRIIKRKVIWDPDEPSTARSLTVKSPKTDSVKSELNTSKLEKKAVTKVGAKAEVSKSPTRSPDSHKSKKRLSEVDKLLMDEGAINMLYAFKNVDEAAKKKKSAVISLDKIHRDLINKTNEIKKDLKTNSEKVSPKSLRRKDSPVPTPNKKIIPASVSRKKSKDSNRSSLHSPPASPSLTYSNHAEASRIIRRHSSSSYSSMDGGFHGEEQNETDIPDTVSLDTDKASKKRVASSASENTKLKRTRKTSDKQIIIVAEGNKASEATLNTTSKLVESETTNDTKYDKYKTFSVREVDHMVQIILLPSFNNEAYLTPEILNELCNIMKELEDDKNCTIVVISSSASSFCHGINYKTLLNDKEQSRKVFARKLATCVTNFLKILATFSKILVAGVHGDTIGLGVTILPLFDMVIASDTATFSVPNARLGCAVEGGSLLSLPHLMHNVLVSELLYASRKLIAAEALRLGMVTRVLWPDKFQHELVSIVKTISNHSSQFMEVTKKQLREHMTQKIDEILNKEVDTLTQHWTSSECQKNFGVYG